MSISKLYKYGRLNGYSEALFSTPTVWFSRPDQLNDPFECRPWFTFSGDSYEIVEALAKILRKRNRLLTEEHAKAFAVSIVLEGRHKDPRTWENMRNELVAMLGAQIGLFCLSESPDNILMWSHYSDNHKGYCLEFQASDTAPLFGAAQQVLYAPDYPRVDFFSTPNELQLDLVFLTKYAEWKYEREWRVIDHDQGPGSHAYDASQLSGVIFGMRMSEADKASIRTWMTQRGVSTKFYQASRSNDTFRVEMQEVT